MKRITALLMIVVLTALIATPSFATYYYGDVNSDGSVNSSDALIVLQASVGMFQLSSSVFKRADINKDGIINSFDALDILRTSVGLIGLNVYDKQNNSDFLVPDESDWKELDSLFHHLYGLDKNYDYKTATSEDVFKRLYDGMGSLSPYEYLLNEKIDIIFDSEDPLDKIENYYASIPIEKFNWIARNVFNIEPETITELKVDDYVYMYSYNDRYYYKRAYGYGLEDRYHLEINSSEKMDDGKYGIVCDRVYSYGYDGEFQTEKVYVVAALKKVDEKRVWSIYSIDNIYNNDPDAVIPTKEDFKTLKSILDNDGGYILYNDFDCSTASKNDFIDVAESYGFVPAYRTYIDNNAFSHDNLIDIDGDGYWNMTVGAKEFNWVLKNIYNYNGSEFTKPTNKYHQIFKNDKIYFWLPPDEGGVYGEFREKGHYERDGIYTVKYSLYQYKNPYDIDSILYHTASYTVTAEFKEVDNVDRTKKVRVWSIHTIEKDASLY